MSIAANTKTTIRQMEPGKIFDYRIFKEFDESPAPVIKAVNRLVEHGLVKRLSKGKFYKPEKGFFGTRKPSDAELLKTVLFANEKRRGYITGVSLHNKLGLTTQLPKTITVAVNGSRQKKDFGTFKVVTKPTRAPIKEEYVELLQYLDVLSEASKIMDADINRTLKIMSKNVAALDHRKRSKLTNLAVDFYGAKTRATLGLLLSSLKLPIPAKLAKAINPTTSFKLNLDVDAWPLAKHWNIK